MYASGTVRSNRKHYPQAALDGGIKSRGDVAFQYHGPLTAGKWRDKRDVHFLLTFLREDMKMIERYSAAGTKESVEKPAIVCDYNQNMFGVDIADQLTVYYACGRRSVKWYKRVFWRLLDRAITNGFVLFKGNGISLQANCTLDSQPYWSRVFTCRHFPYSAKRKALPLHQ